MLGCPTLLMSPLGNTLTHPNNDISRQRVSSNCKILPGCRYCSTLAWPSIRGGTDARPTTVQLRLDRGDTYRKIARDLSIALSTVVADAKADAELCRLLSEPRKPPIRKRRTAD